MAVLMPLLEGMLNLEGEVAEAQILGHYPPLEEALSMVLGVVVVPKLGLVMVAQVGLGVVTRQVEEGMEVMEVPVLLEHLGLMDAEMVAVAVIVLLVVLVVRQVAVAAVMDKTLAVRVVMEP